jgi:hypothetical protein
MPTLAPPGAAEAKAVMAKRVAMIFIVLLVGHGRVG